MYNCNCIFWSQHRKRLVEWMGDIMSFQIVFQSLKDNFSVIIKISAGQRFPTELPGFLVTFSLV